MLAVRMSRISSSPTMKGLIAAENLRKQGFDVVDLGAGEPDFPTPEHVKLAGHRAIDANFTKYTANAGTSELKQAICARYQTDYGVSFSEAECIVTAGGKQALYNAAMVLYNPGDEVITHAPYWPTIPEQIAADKKPYYKALEAADKAWSTERVDVSALESMLSNMLALQLLTATKEAADESANTSPTHQLH